MKINRFVYGILVLTLFFGIVFGFQSAGIWSTSGKVTTDGEAVQPLVEDVDTIKGWMTLEQISATYDVPMAELLSAFDLPADTPPATAIKDLETELFSVTNLRTWLQSRIDSAAPQTENPTESTPQPSSPVETVEGTPGATEQAAPDRTVTGSTTFQDLLDWGVPRESIERIIGGDLPVPSTGVKDYVTGKGLEFAGIKSQLQTEVDRIP
jgi:hypothetical protein